MARIVPISPLRQREERRCDGGHLDAIRALPCLCCASPPRSEAAHLRAGHRGYEKPMTGLGVKPDDRWTLPLCAFCHRLDTDAQHQQGELAFWESQKIDPFAMSQALYQAGSHEERARIVAESLHERGLISLDVMKEMANG